MSNKTITLIELFNKMASFDEQENLPEKIKYRNCVFTIIYGEGISPDYMNENSESLLEYVAAQADDLNEIVEIEEQEEIDIQEINLDFARLGQFSIKNAKGQEEILEVLFIEVQEKMKELARKINYLDKNIKKK